MGSAAMQLVQAQQHFPRRYLTISSSTAHTVPSNNLHRSGLGPGLRTDDDTSAAHHSQLLRLFVRQVPSYGVSAQGVGASYEGRGGGEDWWGSARWHLPLS